MVAYSWTGCFVGGNVGGVWVKSDFTAAPPDPVQSLGSHDASSVLAGAQVGCDYQVGNWVVGIQGDYDWASAKGAAPQHSGPGFLDPLANAVAGLRYGPVGYTWDRFLGYVRGGGARWSATTMTPSSFPPACFSTRQKGRLADGPLGLVASTPSLTLFPALPSTTITISEPRGSRSSRLPARRPSMPTSASASTASKSASTRGGAGRPQSPRDTD